jgi:hypothetical protein
MGLPHPTPANKDAAGLLRDGTHLGGCLSSAKVLTGQGLRGAWGQTPSLFVQYRSHRPPYQDPHEKNVRLTLHYGDLTDSTNLIRIIQEVQPDEIYKLAPSSRMISGVLARSMHETGECYYCPRQR